MKVQGVGIGIVFLGASALGCGGPTGGEQNDGGPGSGGAGGGGELPGGELSGDSRFFLVEPLDEHLSQVEDIESGSASSLLNGLAREGLGSVGYSYFSEFNQVMSQQLMLWSPGSGTMSLGPATVQESEATFTFLLGASAGLGTLVVLAYDELGAKSPFHWNADDGFQPLPSAFAADLWYSYLSADGSLFVAGYEPEYGVERDPILPAYDLEHAEYIPIPLPEGRPQGEVLYVGPTGDEVLGWAEDNQGEGTYFRWTPTGGTEDLSSPDGCDSGVVQETERGIFVLPHCEVPYAYTPDGEWLSLSEGNPPPAGSRSAVVAVSQDGSTLVGSTYLSAPDGYGGVKFLWRHDEVNGFEFGDIPNGDPYLVSADGSVSVGIHSDTLVDPESGPFLWHSGETPTPLPLPDGAISCYPSSMTADAELIFGDCWYGPEAAETKAMVWHDDVVELVQVWLTDRGLDVGDAEFSTAEIDAAGRRLHGRALVGEELRGWVAELAP